MVRRGYLINNLYHLYINVDESVNLSKQTVSAVESKRSKDEINLKYMWHLRLDHIREKKINRLVEDGLLDSFSD